DALFLVRIDDVERLELVLDIHPEPRPGLLLVLGGDVRSALRKVADVPDARLDVELGAEVVLDRPRLRGGFDDDQLRHPHEGSEGAMMRFVEPPSPMYRFLGIVSRPLVYGLFRLEARGIEHLPEGGFVLAANHASNLDPWALGIPLFPRRWLRFMA